MQKVDRSCERAALTAGEHPRAPESRSSRHPTRWAASTGSRSCRALESGPHDAGRAAIALDRCPNANRQALRGRRRWVHSEGADEPEPPEDPADERRAVDEGQTDAVVAGAGRRIDQCVRAEGIDGRHVTEVADHLAGIVLRAADDTAHSAGRSETNLADDQDADALRFRGMTEAEEPGAGGGLRRTGRKGRHVTPRSLGFPADRKSHVAAVLWRARHRHERPPIQDSSASRNAMKGALGQPAGSARAALAGSAPHLGLAAKAPAALTDSVLRSTALLPSLAARMRICFSAGSRRCRGATSSPSGRP
jgi:hypothetical protein